MAKTVTIDASAAMSWLVPAQKTPRAEAFLAGAEALVLRSPDIFAWEIGNLIASRGRRGQLTVPGALESLRLLGIVIAAPRGAEDVFRLTTLATTTGLSLFDAAYLEDALQQGGGLASRDKALLEAAGANGVEIFDLRDLT